METIEIICPLNGGRIGSSHTFNRKKEERLKECESHSASAVIKAVFMNGEDDGESGEVGCQAWEVQSFLGFAQIKMSKILCI